MSTALYRRYRPEAFAELIGQGQVVEPLMAALRADRVNHAYLFSGPRGCGKTTSARILARCLNCAEGPTDTPCGKCPSCIELARGGTGSLDVVEIDAASHNGVDDARELRERAIFAPVRDRYKIFILDEAHMVTTQGFNALLKIVEEPPAHVKFIFATTEPEKVISTIRSRTHHYPFRLVPPGELLEYLGQLSEAEGVKIEAGVLPLVVRAGGGSVRDSLSLLDQLIAGTDNGEVNYQRAVGLLGFTHDALLADVIDAFAELNGAKAFMAVDKVVQSGQDARRFLEDLLERLRDLMLINALGNEAKAILRGMSPEQFDQISIQANRFGMNQLTTAAEATHKALSDTNSISNPRLQLELLCARILQPVSDAKVASTESPAAAPAAKAAPAKSVQPAATTPAPKSPAMPAAAKEPDAPPASVPASVSASAPSAPVSAKPPISTPTKLLQPNAQNFKAHWPEVLADLSKASRSAWAVAFTSKVLDFDADGVLTLLFQSQRDAQEFKNQSGAADRLREVIQNRFGVTVKYRARIADSVAPLPPTPAMPPQQKTTQSPSTTAASNIESIQDESFENEPEGEFDYPPIDAKDLSEELSAAKPTPKPTVKATAAKPVTKATEKAPEVAAKSPEAKPASKAAAKTTAPAKPKSATAKAIDSDVAEVDPTPTPKAKPTPKPTAEPSNEPTERFGESVLREMLGAEPLKEKKS